MARKSSIAKPLSAGETLTYSLGSLGREFSNNCVNAFFLVYLCIYQHLDPIVMTIAFVIAKLWDAVNDPILATIVNNSKKSRFGRYRPWILGGAAVNAVSLVFMFMPLQSAGDVWRYVYYITMYVLWGMSFTVMDVPFWSMLPTIADSTYERNKASSMAKLIGGLGGFLVGMLGTSVVLPNFSSKGMDKAYMILGAVAGLVMITFIMFTVLGNREKYPVPHEKVGLKYIFEIFRGNDQLRAYALNLVLFLTGSSIATTQILYIYVYCYENGANLLASKYSYTMFWVIACTGQGLAMFFYNQLTRRIPREKIYGLSFIGCIISFILMFFVFFVLKEGNYVLNTVLVALSGAFLMLSSGLNQIGSTVMIADVVDYGEYKTGVRGDSVMFSIQTLILKFAGAIAMLILGIGIAAASLPNIYDLPLTDTRTGVFHSTVQAYRENDGTYLFYDGDVRLVDGVYLYVEKTEGEDGTQTEELYALPEGTSEHIKVVGEGEKLISDKSLVILRAFMFLIPIPLTAAGYLVYKKKFWLYGSRYDEIKREIDARRAAVSTEAKC